MVEIGQLPPSNAIWCITVWRLTYYSSQKRIAKKRAKGRIHVNGSS